jgi:hypothetical protein
LPPLWKPDWCYRIGELEVCHRQAPPATDGNKRPGRIKKGVFFYAPTVEQQPIYPKPTVRRSGFIGENALLAAEEKAIRPKPTVRRCGFIGENARLAARK